jgi:hypothetical protein
MTITIQSPFDSAVLESNKDVFTRSYIEGRNSIIEFDMRKRDYKKEFKITSQIYWVGKEYTIDINEFSTLHNPILYRFILMRGYYLNEHGNRVDFTPKISEVSTHHHVSSNILRLSCYLAVICGVSLRNIAAIFSNLFQIPIGKSSIQRWIDEIGTQLPSDEDILKKLIKIKEVTECHIDGYYPLGTKRCVMVIKDEHDRILITHETDTENADEAKKFLEKLKAAGITINSIFSDYSKSFIKAIQEVFPDARFQADHFHSAKIIWENLKKSLSGYRRKVKSAGEEKQDEEMIEIASELWELRWSLLKKASNLTDDEREKIESLENRDTGFISKFRSIICGIVNIFDRSNSEIQAEVKVQNLKKQIEEINDSHLSKIGKFFDAHWNEALQFLKKRGLGKYKRSSNSESGMRILRRLEKNHDGIRSETMRKNYIKIYQVIKYLSIDIIDFLNGGSRKKL